MNFDVNEIRKDFPILNQKVNGHDLVYLDSAATSQKPKAVIEGLERYYTEYNSNIHRSAHKLAELATIAYEEAHEKAARLINADSDEVIFTAGTTESLNLAAYSLIRMLKKGDKIVLTEMEHHSNLVPWQQLAKEKNLKLGFLKVKDFKFDLDQAKEIIDEGTKIVSVMHASNVLGTVNPVREIGKLVHKMGAVFVVDGAHSVPNMAIDVKQIDCDFLAFSGHKMCGPTGAGVLYGKKRLLEQMPPFLYGGHMISEVTLNDSSWNDLPWKFEAGTANIAGGIGLGIAIDYLNNIGMKNIHEYERLLSRYAIEKLGAVKNLEIYGPLDGERTAAISFNIKGIHTHDLSSILDRYGIATRGGHHCAMPLMNLLKIDGCSRASMYFYNTVDEIDKLVEAIKKAKQVFRVD